MDGRINCSIAAFALTLWAAALAEVAEDSKSLIDLAATDLGKCCVPSSDQVAFSQSGDAAAPGLTVNIVAGEAGYPGLGLMPQGAAWDLSRFGHVEARITDLGEKALSVNMRVDNADGFITSGLLWTPGSAVYYCNGKVVAQWENPRVSNVQSYPILYTVTGGWDNNALDDDQLPADFVIDYIRIWQRKDLASKVDGKIAPVAIPAMR